MMRVAGIILAAGRSTRFGSPKPLAEVDGRPMLERVLEIAHVGGLDPVVVVLGAAAGEIEPAIEWGSAMRIRNPEPERGLASSLAIAINAAEALDPPIDGAVILLGDQPRLDPRVIERLLAAGARSPRPALAPRYAGGGGANPVFLRRSAFDLAREAAGDHGLGPILAARPDLVEWVDVEGSNPDIDTPADLARLSAGADSAPVAAGRSR